MAGVPTIFMGNAEWAGCEQKGESGYSVHLTGATVAAGNAQVVSNGALVLK
jgi:hypothetical protein